VLGRGPSDEACGLSLEPVKDMLGLIPGRRTGYVFRAMASKVIVGSLSETFASGVI